MRFSVLVSQIFSGLKKSLLILLLLFVLKCAWTVIMYESGGSIIGGENKSELLARKAFLVDRVIAKTAGTADMPSHLGAQFQGEWALVTYSMLSAALTNIAHRYPETQQQALQYSRLLIERTLAEDTRRFDTARWGEDPLDSLDGPNGHIGYLGHLNWMLSAYRYLGGTDYKDLFRDVSYALARRMKENNYKCLETYPNELRYSADNLVVVAALANYSRLNSGELDDVVQNWLKEAKIASQHTETGLLPFHYDFTCGASGDARGSGAGWNSFYLPYVDQEFADQQYDILKKHFVQRRLFTGIREYRKGVWGPGDVDSGPVIFGFSPSGTGFTIGGATHAEDRDLLSGLLFTSEFVGSTVQWNGERYYLLAPLVGEAIMLAMKTAIVWDGQLGRQNS
jgi:hypothetical protein